MTEPWHDIDHPGVWRKPQTAPADATSTRAQQEPPADEKREIWVKLSKGEFLPPDEGVTFNQKCKVRVKVDYLNDQAKSMKKVTFSLFSVYKGTTKSLSHTVDGYEKDGYAEAVMTMHYPPDHQGDDSAELFFTAYHIRAEKDHESEKITLPHKEKKSSLSDSVGQDGKNQPDDVKLVKKKLKELGYPVKDESETISPEDIKAIKFFQIAIANVSDNIKTYQPVRFPDGLVSKARATEKKLFDQNPPKYEMPEKKSIKAIADDVKKKMDDATGDEKKLWDKIKEVWDTISPYLPDDSSMTSGYRSKDEQRKLLQSWYNVKYKSEIIEEYDEEEWKKYKEMQGKNDAQADVKMCQMIKEATGQLIAVPGSSAHERGHAIDLGGQSDVQQVKNLLWCNCELPNHIVISKILPERNGCLHFEFS